MISTIEALSNAMDSTCQSWFVNQSILSVDQFDLQRLRYLFHLTDLIRPLKGHVTAELLKGFVLGNLFFEASTRSRMSFSSAFLYLGGLVNSTTGVTFSSIAKGESLVDTCRVISTYCDVMVIRHPECGSALQAAASSTVPVINAGDGHGEHPTQALLDLYTIVKEKPQVEGLTVTMVGDLRFGRTVHSLIKLLCLYPNISFVFAAPDIVQLPDEYQAFITKSGNRFQLTDSFDDAIAQADVIYSTRIQKERFTDPDEYKSIEDYFILTKEKVTRLCKPDVTIMHPLPRLTEIATDVDALTKQASYFRQAENGLYVRMALFLAILDHDGSRTQAIIQKSII